MAERPLGRDRPEPADEPGEPAGSAGSLSATAADPDELGTALSRRLETLFATILPSSPDGRPHSNADIAERATAAGYPISESYVYQLRRGPRNPTLRALQALAAAFGVPVQYFVDDEFATEIEADLPVLAALREPAIREMVLLLGGLSAPTLAALTQFALTARQWEGLPDPEQ